MTNFNFSFLSADASSGVGESVEAVESISFRSVVFLTTAAYTSVVESVVCFEPFSSTFASCCVSASLPVVKNIYIPEYLLAFDLNCMWNLLQA